MRVFSFDGYNYVPCEVLHWLYISKFTGLHGHACLLLFWYFQSPTAETPAWILTLNTSNDVVLRKEVPFEGYEN